MTKELFIRIALQLFITFILIGLYCTATSQATHFGPGADHKGKNGLEMKNRYLMQGQE